MTTNVPARPLLQKKEGSVKPLGAMKDMCVYLRGAPHDRFHTKCFPMRACRSSISAPGTSPRRRCRARPASARTCSGSIGLRLEVDLHISSGYPADFFQEGELRVECPIEGPPGCSPMFGWVRPDPEAGHCCATLSDGTLKCWGEFFCRARHLVPIARVWSRKR